VIIIESDAFIECGGFKGELKIPNSVVEIHDNAFAYCSGFTGNVILNEKINLKDISYAFVFCINLRIYSYDRKEIVPNKYARDDIENLTWLPKLIAEMENNFKKMKWLKKT
jgi:hypothetical protein